MFSLGREEILLALYCYRYFRTSCTGDYATIYLSGCNVPLNVTSVNVWGFLQFCTSLQANQCEIPGQNYNSDLESHTGLLSN